MLILRRRKGESILLEVEGIKIWMELMDWQPHHGQVRLGFTAPREVRITRTELLSDYPHQDGAD